MPYQAIGAARDAQRLDGGKQAVTLKLNTTFGEAVLTDDKHMLVEAENRPVVVVSWLVCTFGTDGPHANQCVHDVEIEACAPKKVRVAPKVPPTPLPKPCRSRKWRHLARLRRSISDDDVARCLLSEGIRLFKLSRPNDHITTELTAVADNLDDEMPLFSCDPRSVRRR